MNKSPEISIERKKGGMKFISPQARAHMPQVSDRSLQLLSQEDAELVNELF